MTAFICDEGWGREPSALLLRAASGAGGETASSRHGPRAHVLAGVVGQVSSPQLFL